MDIKNYTAGNLEKLGQYNCKTKHKTDDLWICLVGDNNSCPFSILYKSEKYCTHRNNMNFKNAHAWLAERL
jgi:hypothetical protein